MPLLQRRRQGVLQVRRCRAVSADGWEMYHNGYKGGHVMYIIVSIVTAACLYGN